MRCARCAKTGAPAPGGFCAPCLAAVRAEVEAGWLELDAYLARWAEFADWCAARGLASR